MKQSPKPRASSAAGGGGGSKFGAVLRRNTHRMAFVLIYTLLEWLLIALLLLNGLLSCLISRFASFFGLAPPCAFCSRLDRLFDPAAADCRRLLCDAHAADVSRLAFCSLHRRLAPAADMCDDCSASRPAASDRAVALLSYTKKKTKRDGDGDDEKEEEVEEEEEKRFTCSCCEADLGDGEFGSPYLLLKPSWDVAGAGREDYDVEGLDGDVIFEVEDGKIGNVLALALDREEEHAIEFSDSRPLLGDDDSMELVTSRIVSEPDDEERRIPLELIDSTNGVVKATMSPALSSRVGGGEEEEEEDDGEGGRNQFILEEKVGEDHDREIREETVLDHEPGAEASLEGEAFVGPRAREEDSKSTDVEANCEISIGSEICEQEQPEQGQFQEQVREPAKTEDRAGETFNDTVDEGRAIEPELNEVDEDRTPETPTHSEGIHGLHKRFFFERRESGAESFDGSVASELDGGEPSSVDQLKSALKSEHKALNALYAELEEERSASAVAASETMAMINRLQEEKAAMKMEALQYQRMMEEQSEYDQEALQLLNELLVKREKEKQGLEKELEVYREKVLIYETKERKRIERQQKQNGKNGLSSSSSSSLSSSSAEESDDLLFDYCERGDLVRSRDQSNVTTPDAETAKHLVDGSLADFEEERLSILEQLKTLEERLFALENDDSDYVKMTESFSEGNPHESNEDSGALVDDLDVPADGFSDDLDDNGGKFHSEGKYASCRGKRLLPLFDAAALETEDRASAKQDAVQESTSPKAVSELAKEQEKLLIAEEIDDLYDRLQALEADREFLKHCVKSLKKGDKGLNLLEEILQHLRDLRSVELRVRKAGDDAPALLTV